MRNSGWGSGTDLFAFYRLSGLHHNGPDSGKPTCRCLNGGSLVAMARAMTADGVFRACSAYASILTSAKGLQASLFRFYHGRVCGTAVPAVVAVLPEQSASVPWRFSCRLLAVFPRAIIL